MIAGKTTRDYPAIGGRVHKVPVFRAIRVPDQAATAGERTLLVRVDPEPPTDCACTRR